MQKWKVYKYVIEGNILLSFISIALHWYSLKILKLPFTTGNLILLIAIFIIISHSLYFLRLINNRFPDKGISSAIEGCAYTLNIMNLLSCTYLLLYVSIYLYTFIEKYQSNFQLYKNTLFITIVLYFFLTGLSIIAVIFSFQLLSFLNKNRLAILNQ